jgi:hypothetical protein
MDCNAEAFDFRQSYIVVFQFLDVS